jgi:hypothetical protein
MREFLLLFILPSIILSPRLQRQVTLEEATAKANELSIMFMETSAKAGHNVKSLFKKIALSLPGMEKEGAADGQNASNASACIFLFLFYKHCSS